MNKKQSKQDYLTNSICRFVPINFTPDVRKKINIYSLCFFKMKKHYKGFDKYVYGLEKVLKFIKKNITGYKVRLFVDQNILDDKQIMEMLKNYDIAQIVLFECANYMKDGFHFDLFGTMVRFFPFFDFPNNDAAEIISGDIDTFNKKALLDTFRFPVGNTFLGRARLNGVLNAKPYPYMMADFLKTSGGFDNAILIDFIKNISDNKSKGRYGQRETPFGYGVDEIFLNEVLFPQLDHILAYRQYNASLVIFREKQQIHRDKTKNKQRIKTFYEALKSILGKYYVDNMSTKQMMNFVDKKLYNPTYPDAETIYLFRRIIKFMKFTSDNNLKFGPKNIIKFILRDLSRTLCATLIIKKDIKGDTKIVKFIDHIEVPKNTN